MSGAHAPARAPVAAARDWLATVVNGALVAAVGVLLGLQYVSPNKRVLQVLAAVIVFGVAWRLDTVTGIGVLLLALPFPRGTVFGNTNLALILLLLVIWLLRFSTGHSARPERTPLDAPIVGLLVAYLISFYNVEAQYLHFAINNFMLVIGSALTYVLVVNNVRTEADLRRIHGFYLAALLAILLVSAFELLNPGRPLVAGWIDFGHQVTEGAEVRNLRIGGPFFDFEQLGEFCAISLMFLLFLYRQSASTSRRVLLAGVGILALIILFATATRGAIVSLAVALLYLGWLVRRRLRLIPLTIGILVVGAGGTAVFAMVNQFTLAGDVFARLGETHFVGGLPDSRAEVWPQAVERWLHHPIIGWGPYYTARRGLDLWYWPHNLFLFVLNSVGIVGFAFFAWMLWRLWRATRPDTDDLGHPDYVRGYLLVARVQFMLLMVDQIKIEFLRNPYYQAQVWMLFSLWMAASRIRARSAAAPDAAERASGPGPVAA